MVYKFFRLYLGVISTNFMKTLFSIFLILFTGILHSQDQLFKKDNSKFEVKVLEITPTEIKYKLFNYQDGPTITIAKSDVALVIYQNGVHEVFNSNPVETPPVIVYKEPVPTEQKPVKLADSLRIKELLSTKSLLSFNVLDPLNGSIGVSYLREFAGNWLNVYVPLSTGFTEPFLSQPSYNITGNSYNFTNVYDFKFTRKVVEVGLGIHFQSSGKRTVTHFIGPYFGMAQLNGTFKTNNYDPNYGSNYYEPMEITHGFVMNRYYLMLNNGVFFRVTKHFNIIMQVALGRHIDTFVANNPADFYNSPYYATYSKSNEFPINSVKMGLLFAYRF